MLNGLTNTLQRHGCVLEEGDLPVRPPQFGKYTRLPSQGQGVLSKHTRSSTVETSVPPNNRQIERSVAPERPEERPKPGLISWFVPHKVRAWRRGEKRACR